MRPHMRDGVKKYDIHKPKSYELKFGFMYIVLLNPNPMNLNF